MGVAEALLILLGLYVVLPKLIFIYQYIQKIVSFKLSKGTLIEKFGNKGWAVVTGCTAGIGEQITYRLAQQGFNLLLIGRSIEKLKNVQANCKGVETIIIQADLCSQAMDFQMYERIRNECSELNIVILVNNAGVLYNGYFRDQSANQIREQVIVNTYPYELLTSALLPNLIKSGKKACIMNLASSASFQPQPYSAIYGATKVFDRFFSEALQIELNQNPKSKHLEVMTVCPMFVQTNMTHNVAPSWSTGVTSCEQYVHALINSLANQRFQGVFIGPMYHTIQACINQLFFGMVHQYRFPYYAVEKYLKGVIEIQEKGQK